MVKGHLTVGHVRIWRFSGFSSFFFQWFLPVKFQEELISLLTPIQSMFMFSLAETDCPLDQLRSQQYQFGPMEHLFQPKEITFCLACVKKTFIFLVLVRIS